MADTEPGTDPRIAAYRAFLEQIEREHLADDPGRSAEGGASADYDEIDVLGRSILSVTSRLAERFEQERQLIGLSEEIVQGVYRDEVLDHIYDSFRGVIPYDRIGCALLEDEGRIVRAKWSRTDYPDVRIRPGFAAKIDHSSLQGIIDTGQPRIINDTVEYLAEHPNSTATKLILREGIRSSLTCPLIAMGRPIGFLFFSSREPYCYESVHQEIFTRVAGMVSIAVEKGILYEELSELNREMMQARALLEYEASHDSLTGLPNREAVLKRLEHVWQEREHQEHDERKSLGVMMLDIDHFKSINDTYGHPVGDEVLKAVAHTISAQLRATDVVGRYGGEEFLAVVATSGGPKAIAARAEQIRSAVEHNLVITERGNIGVTISIGVAVLEASESESVASMIQRADDALYKAKTDGRNRAVLSALGDSPPAD